MESFCLYVRTELPCFLLGDSVGFLSSGESGSSILLAEVEFVEPSLPTGLWCLAAVETFVVDDADEIVEVLEAWLCVGRLGNAGWFVGAHGEDASAALRVWSS